MDKGNWGVLVVGAWGAQGNAAVRHLLGSAWRVRVLAPDPGEPAMRELAWRGAEVAVGDPDDEASVRLALEGCYGCFVDLGSWLTDQPRLVRQGLTVAELARAGSIRHYVYCSAGSAEPGGAMERLRGRLRVEEHIRTLGLPATILRPAWLMDDFGNLYGLEIAEGLLRMPLSPARRLQMIAAEDVGRIAAACFDNPHEFIGRAIRIAADELTAPQVADILSRAVGRKVSYVRQSLEDASRRDPGLADVFRWLDGAGYQAFVQALRLRFPEAMTFESWVQWAGSDRVLPKAVRYSA